MLVTWIITYKEANTCRYQTGWMYSNLKKVALDYN